MNNKNKYLKNDSFLLTSFLLSERCELAGIEKSPNPKKLIFVFYDAPSVRNLITDFYGLKAFVRPQDFANAQRNLRSIIYGRLND